MTDVQVKKGQAAGFFHFSDVALTYIIMPSYTVYGKPHIVKMNGLYMRINNLHGTNNASCLKPQHYRTVISNY